MGPLKQRIPGFVYIYSANLKQEIALSEKTGVVYCQDKTRYTTNEVQILDHGCGEITLAVHLVGRLRR
jgi:hypothetical protein